MLFKLTDVQLRLIMHRPIVQISHTGYVPMYLLRLEQMGIYKREQNIKQPGLNFYLTVKGEETRDILRQLEEMEMLYT